MRLCQSLTLLLRFVVIDLVFSVALFLLIFVAAIFCFWLPKDGHDNLSGYCLIFVVGCFVMGGVEWGDLFCIGWVC